MKRKVNIKNVTVLIVTALSTIILLNITVWPYFKGPDYDKMLSSAKQMNLKNLSADMNELFLSLSNNFKNSQLDFMVKDYQEYPVDLLYLLERNSDTYQFVSQYPTKKDEPTATTLDKEELNALPLLTQWDQRWGYQTYGDGLMAITGCGPTVLAMVISYLTQEASITPYSVAQWAQNNGYYVEGAGSSWAIMTDYPALYNIQSNYISLSAYSIQNSLNEGKPIILSMNPGDFTRTGHFIVLSSVNADGTIQVKDPNSIIRSQKSWDVETLIQQAATGWQLSK